MTQKSLAFSSPLEENLAAVVDVGSNSVRLVIYDRSFPTPSILVNERILGGLGKKVMTLGKLTQKSVEQTLIAFRRFKVIIELMAVKEVFVIATAALREASNAGDFKAQACEILGRDLDIISGEQEAELAAYGVMSLTYRPDGLVADFGGGSLEICDVQDQSILKTASIQLGGLFLRDLSEGVMKKAEQIVSNSLNDVSFIPNGEGRDLFIVGGVWRTIARFHLASFSGSLLKSPHGLILSPEKTLALCENLENPDSLLLQHQAFPERRQALVPYGALVLKHILKRAKPGRIYVSSGGVREGALYKNLPKEQRPVDPLLATLMEWKRRSFSSHEDVETLFRWSENLFRFFIQEYDERLIKAACYCASIRVFPADRRHEMMLQVLSNSTLPGADCITQLFIMLTICFRNNAEIPERLHSAQQIISEEKIYKAKVLGTILKLANLLTQHSPHHLSRILVSQKQDEIVIRLPSEMAALVDSSLEKRLKKLSMLTKRKMLFSFEQPE